MKECGFSQKTEWPLKGLLLPSGQIDGINHRHTKELNMDRKSIKKTTTSQRYTVSTMWVDIGSKRLGKEKQESVNNPKP